MNPDANELTPHRLERNDDGTVNVIDLLHTVLAHWRLLIGGPLLIGVLAFALSWLVRPTYTAITSFFPPQQQQTAAAAMLQNLGALGGLAGAAAGIKNPASQYVTLLESKTLVGALVDRFKLRERYGADWKEEAIEVLSRKANINASKEGLITIEVKESDPQFAAGLANAYVEELQRMVGRLALTEAQQRRLFFEKQLLQTKNNLAHAELALKQSGVDLSALKANPESAVRAVAELQAQITAQEVKLAGLRRFATDSSAEVKEARAGLAALRREQDKISRSDVATSPNDADYVARYRDVKYYETLFELFAKQFELAKVDEAKEGPIIQVVDLATPPERRSHPRRIEIALLSFLGTWLALIVFLFVRESVRHQAANDPVLASKLKQFKYALRR